MDNSVYKVNKWKKEVDLTADVPSSKSVLARALVLSALSDGKCTLNNVVLSQDTRTMLVALRDLGFSVFFSAGMKQVRIQGMNGEIPKKEATIYVGNSGTAARFLVGMLALTDGTYTVNASQQMMARPMKELIVILRKLGAKISCPGKEGHFPIKIEGKRPKENKDIDVVVDVTRSTQFVSSLLMVLPLMNCNSKITTVGSFRDAYIKMTVKMVERFGQSIECVNNEYRITGNGHYTSSVFDIEPDVSSACYFYTLPMLFKGKAKVNKVTGESVQGDMDFLKLLESLGAKLTEDEDGGLVLSYDKELPEGDLSFDMENFSDQTATLAILSAIRKGSTTISGIGHIRHQECDRISVIRENLENCGIKCIEFDDSMTIIGGKPHGATINPHGDHRMAMAFTILGLLTGDMIITDYECVGKTFAEFFEEIEKHE